ncbi:MAG: hypothetical protein EAY81_10520 [Bacteroidetes bacterium]|nr:MAG: hypothetical protein EAY81_10520 [Bacteroidota bacterium]
MNTIDYTQTGGFPLDQNVLAFMQAQSQLAQLPAHFGGQLCIISGCTVTGTSVTAGFVAINGEVLPFNGGTISPKVIIVETATNLTYEDGNAKPVQKIRYATFGDDGVQNNLWANFKRNTTEGVLARLERLEWIAAPFLNANASMVFWRKPASVPLPAGWQEVIDWRGRLAMGHKVGVAGFAVGDVTGKEGHVMTLDNLIEHDHPYKDIFYSEFGGSIGLPNNYGSGRSDNDNSGHQIDRVTSKTGFANPTPIPTLPPVKIIMYIEPIPNYIA